MKATRSFLKFSVLVIWSTLYGVKCCSHNIRFSRAEFLDGNVCTEGSVIQNTNYVTIIQCLSLCSTQSQCRGVFLETEVKRCVTCSARFFTQSNLTQSKFYKRHETTGNSTYMLIPQDMEWYVAKQNCENLGGHLLIITSQEENDYIIQNAFADASANNIWIGGKGTGGRATTFTWVDSSALSDGYTNWRTGQPYPHSTEEAHIELLRIWNFKWNDQIGGIAYSICEFEPNIYVNTCMP